LVLHDQHADAAASQRKCCMAAVRGRQHDATGAVECAASGRAEVRVVTQDQDRKHEASGRLIASRVPDASGGFRPAPPEELMTSRYIFRARSPKTRSPHAFDLCIMLAQ